MGAITGLTLDLDAAVRGELRPGEELWYAGMPKPWCSARKALPIAVFGLFFGGFAAFWITMAAAGVWFGGMTAKEDAGSKVVSGVFMLFPLFGLPFLLVGLAMISSPWWIARKARRTACCVTSERAMQLTLGRATVVRSWSADEIDEVSKTIYADGTGSIQFARSSMQTSKGRMRTVSEGFDGIPDPRACEDALRALKDRADAESATRSA
jgi:hypothetical protein